MTQEAWRSNEEAWMVLKSQHVTTEETGSAMDKRYRETALGGLAADYERSLQETPQLQLVVRGGPGRTGEDPLDSEDSEDLKVKDLVNRQLRTRWRLQQKVQGWKQIFNLFNVVWWFRYFREFLQNQVIMFWASTCTCWLMLTWERFCYAAVLCLVRPMLNHNLNHNVSF